MTVSERGLVPALDHEFVQPLQATRDLGADRPASRGGGAGAARHGVQPRADWHELDKQAFAAEMAKLLTDAATRNKFDRLVLVAPPKVLGTLRRRLGRQASQRITADSPKDLTHVALHDLPRHLQRLILI